MPKAERGYVLDLHTPVRHVATEMERAYPDALSVEAMAATYEHPNPGDFARIKLHEGAKDDAEVNVWFVREALSRLMDRPKGGTVWVEETDGGFRFADGVTFDSLRVGRKKLARIERSVFGDPFHPRTGQFSSNVRVNGTDDDLHELRESFKAFGWIKHFPALVDEREVVLVGHRRIKVADELGIPREIKPIRLGLGDAADAERLKIALASNIGGRRLDSKDRRRIATHLYGEGWTMARIAEALNVSTRTAYNAVDFATVAKSTKRGRPKKMTSEQDDRVVEMVEEHNINPSGNLRDRVVEEFAIGQHAAQLAIERATGRIEQKAATAATAPPVATPETSEMHECPACGFLHRPK